jgi:hypothetical protein
MPLQPVYRLNKPLIIPPARFLAIPDPYIAFEAKPVAWLNLSHLEKASVFVIVRTSAMTAGLVSLQTLSDAFRRQISQFLPSLANLSPPLTPSISGDTYQQASTR